MPSNGNGVVISDWARKIESQISETLDSFDPKPLHVIGHSELASLSLLKPHKILIAGRPVAARVLVMFDDVHKLASSQRQTLGRALGDMRGETATWIAERLEALKPDELLVAGSRNGRDYSENSPTLEHYWRKYSIRFERTVQAIADKRVREAQRDELDSFGSCVPSNLETPEIKSALAMAAAEVERAVKSDCIGNERFKHWLEAAETAEGSAHIRGVAWQAIDILIEREKRKSQLAFDFALTPEELDKKNDSAVKAAAELFLADRFNLPYYFGFPRLALLASSNIEQFLAIASELFEEACSSATLKQSFNLSVKRQHTILKKVAKKWWEQDALTGLPSKTEVRQFVEAIGKFAKKETYRPNAPYAPGVSGISITMAERDRLCDLEFIAKRKDLQLLSRVIGICLAHNILEVDLDRSQGNDRHMILYLNRLLCCHYDLALQYGGWRAQKLETLSLWVEAGFSIPANNGQLPL